MAWTSKLPRRWHTAALRAFRRLPAPMRRGLVRMGTPKFTVGAVCLVEHGNQLLFLRQPHRRGWSLPGGLLDRGESSAHAVIREVREETGLELEVGIPLTTQVNARVRRVDVIYRVEVELQPPVRPGGEARAAEWLHPDEVLAGADAPTQEIIALWRAARRDSASTGRVVAAAGA
jgi:ADP-ribose pyrophosphatase YjhB (NUDIX family)